jgi:hypothetical protein
MSDCHISIFRLNKNPIGLSRWARSKAWVCGHSLVTAGSNSAGAWVSVSCDCVLSEVSAMGRSLVKRNHTGCVCAVAYPEFFSGGVQQIQLGTEGGENRELGAVVP